MNKRPISVLFCMSDSIYKSFPECDVFDKNRNALTFDNSGPVVAHPPCRSWSKLRSFARPEVGERALAIWAIWTVRLCGGVLEHPASSQLWKTYKLPLGQEVDEWGGYTISVDQCWFGHRARKSTWLYIVGCPKMSLPEWTPNFSPHEFGVCKGRHTMTGITTKERNVTPASFAQFLIDIASNCTVDYSLI